MIEIIYSWHPTLPFFFFFNVYLRNPVGVCQCSNYSSWDPLQKYIITRFLNQDDTNTLFLLYSKFQRLKGTYEAKQNNV